MITLLGVLRLSSKVLTVTLWVEDSSISCLEPSKISMAVNLHLACPCLPVCIQNEFEEEEEGDGERGKKREKRKKKHDD